MRIDLQLDTSGVLSKLEALEGIEAKVNRALLRTATQGRNIIERRSLSGKGLFGAFKPYTDKYRKYRAKKGRQVSPVNLEFTGNMFISMQPFPGNGFADIAFTRAAESKKAFFNNRKRPFFGFTNPEKRKLFSFFISEVKS